MLVPDDPHGLTNKRLFCADGGGCSGHAVVLWSGDVDGDGLPDLTATAPDGRVAVYLAAPNGLYAPQIFDMGADIPGRVTAREVTGDGIPDLLMVDEDGAPTPAPAPHGAASDGHGSPQDPG